MLVRGDGRTGGVAGVDPDTLAGRLDPGADRAGSGQEALRVLGVDPQLDGVPLGRQRGRVERRRQPGRDAQLLLDQVHAVHRLGDRVLDLQPGVHLQEEELAGGRVEQALDGAGVAVADGLTGADGGGAQPGPQLRRNGRRRGLLEYLLVAPPHRALPLAQRHDPPIGAPEDLYLDVPYPGEVPLDEHRPVAEHPLGEPAYLLELRRQAGRIRYRGHAHPAAAGRRLDHDRVPDATGLGERRLDRGGRVGGTGSDRYPGGRHQVPRVDLVAHRVDRARVRTDPDQSLRGDRAGEVGVLRQEPVPRMDRLRTGGLRGREDRLDVAVRLRRADGYRLVGLGDERQPGIDVGVHRHGVHAEPARGADDPAGDLSPVGDQQRADHRYSSLL